MIPLFKVRMPESVMEPLWATLLSGFVGQGARVDEFERLLGPEMQSGRVLTTNSGTSAIHLALRLAGVGAGDEVICSPMTCTASNMPALERGAHIVWADIDPRDGNMDPCGIERLITPETKAIIPVHFGGYPCDMDSINEIALAHDIAVIEDAAHALGAVHKGARVGSLSRFTCFHGSTKINTTKGLVAIKHILPGDLVFSEDGQPHRVANVLKQPYAGPWTRIKVGQVSIAATDNHPVKIHRDGQDQWLPIGDARPGDAAYVLTKLCERCNQRPVPIYTRICAECFIEADHGNGKREKLSQLKQRNRRPTSRLIHHSKWVQPHLEQYEAMGYRVIPLIYALPDFLAIKDGKIIAVEVESGPTVRAGKENKYESLGQHNYDDVVWITQTPKREAKRYQYTIIGQLARVPISRVWHNHGRHRTDTVYNLTIDGDPTYFAKGVLVHNCFSFQAIKALTTVDGGALACKNPEDYRRGKLLRWYGINRETPRQDARCEDDIAEYGYKFHMNDVAATIGIEGLKGLYSAIGACRSNAFYYNCEIEDRGFKHIKRLEYCDDRLSSYWLYTILVNNRPSFVEWMTAHGIHVSRVHARNDKHTCFRDAGNLDNLPGVDEFDAHQISIPCGWWVTRDERETIMDAIAAWERTQ